MDRKAERVKQGDLPGGKEVFMGRKAPKSHRQESEHP